MLGLIGWLLLVVLTFGIALVYLLFGFLFYLFAHSAFISWLRGNAVLLSQAQLPDLRERFEACCTRLGMEEMPEAYLMQGGGTLNAFATRFLGRNYVVLLSDIVDAMEEHPDGVDFYFGHELGHIRRHHLTGNLLRAPVLWLPLLGAAYSRASEYTCDRHGRACCDSPESAARAVVALAAGARRWRQMDLPAYAGQAALTSGFWMSFHELTNGYPWLTKRTVRVLDPAAPVPRRNPFAWLLALFVPYAGRAGRGFGGLIVIAAIIGILAAIAIPAFKDYEARARLRQRPRRQRAGAPGPRRLVPVSTTGRRRRRLQEAGLPDDLARRQQARLRPRRRWCSGRDAARRAGVRAGEPQRHAAGLALLRRPQGRQGRPARGLPSRRAGAAGALTAPLATLPPACRDEASTPAR